MLLLDGLHVDMSQEGLIGLCSEDVNDFILFRTALIGADNEGGDGWGELRHSLVGRNYVLKTLLVLLILVEKSRAVNL